MKNSGLTVNIIIALLLGLTVLTFAAWAFGTEYSLLSMLLAAVCAGVLGLCIVRHIPAAAGFVQPEEEPPQLTRDSRFDRRHPWVSIAFAVLLLHAALYAFAYAVDTALIGYTGGLLDTAERLFVRQDAARYLDIAMNGYSAGANIKLYPLYPLLVRLFAFLTGSAFHAAVLVSTLGAIASSIVAYELAALDMPRRDALAAAFFLAVLPGGIFLLAPMSESVFLPLSMAAVLLARRGRFLPASLLGALAALSRPLGVLLIIPLAMEFIARVRGGQYEDTGSAVRSGLCLPIVLCGLLVFLGINYAVTGDALAFVAEQRAASEGGFRLFFASVAEQFEGFMEKRLTDGPSAYTLYLPNLICSLGALALILAGSGKERPSYTAYTLIYFVVATGATSLLSAARHLFACFPLPFTLARLTAGRRLVRALAALLLMSAMGVYLLMYTQGYYVY